MTGSWHAYHIHYTEIDHMILACVTPFLERVENQLERRSWERHYLGGPHLRVRLRAPGTVLERVGPALCDTARRFIAERPSADLPSYSSENAEELTFWEGLPVADRSASRYRNNVVERHSYPPRQHPYVSRQAAALMEDFRHDVMPFAVRLMTGDRPLRERILRLYFLNAMLACGDLARGSVTWKSHWEAFAATSTSEVVLERIAHTYRDHGPRIRQLLRQVVARAESDSWSEDPDLAGWTDLVNRYRTRTQQALDAGHQLTPQASTLEEAAEHCRDAARNMRRPNAFVDRFVSNVAFVASMQFDHAMLVPRTLTNLFYALVASVGLKPIDKLSLCYFAHRAVEDELALDLDEIFAATIERVTRTHAHRLAAVAAAPHSEGSAAALEAS